MTTPARLVTALLALAVAACSFLPWAGERNAWNISLRSLTTPGLTGATSRGSSIGLVVVIAAAGVLLGDLVDRVGVVLVGALVSMAVPIVWIATNTLDHTGTGLATSVIGIGAYACVAAALMILVLLAASSYRHGPAVH